MINDTYYRIIETADFVEYHFSAYREDVIHCDALCRRIKKDNPYRDDVVASWEAEATAYDAQRV